MGRSRKKGYFCAEEVTRKIQRAIETGSRSPIKIRGARGSVIPPEYIGYHVLVHNGRTFIPVKITANHVGRKFGEYAETRKFGGHSGDKKSTLKKR